MGILRHAQRRHAMTCTGGGLAVFAEMDRPRAVLVMFDGKPFVILFAGTQWKKRVVKYRFKLNIDALPTSLLCEGGNLNGFTPFP